jgi:hypothetical protein
MVSVVVGAPYTYCMRIVFEAVYFTHCSNMVSVVVGAPYTYCMRMVGSDKSLSLSALLLDVCWRSQTGSVRALNGLWSQSRPDLSVNRTRPPNWYTSYDKWDPFCFWMFGGPHRLIADQPDLLVYFGMKIGPGLTGIPLVWQIGNIWTIEGVILWGD